MYVEFFFVCVFKLHFQKIYCCSCKCFCWVPLKAGSLYLEKNGVKASCSIRYSFDKDVC